MNLGCNGFIQKPFDILELSQKLRAVLNDGGKQIENVAARKFE
jgi:DNA-binding response OmpR family regulator